MPSDLIFDFFGTLVHYVAGPFHTAPYERTHSLLLHHNFPIDYTDFVELYGQVANTLETQAKQSSREYHMDDAARAFFHTVFASEVPDVVLQEFVATFIEEWSRGIRYIDGIGVFLSELAAAYRLSILSNTHYPALIHDNLTRMEAKPYFNYIVTSVEYGWRKPHPSIFQHLLTILAVPAQDVLYIGDTYSDDYEGARSAGMRAILIDPQNQYPHLSDRISSLHELKYLLKAE
jgi:putative hydrolase of the HAD superfamily